MRIAYFGLPLGALLLSADTRTLVSAVVSRKDAPGFRRLRRVLGKDRVRLRGEDGQGASIDWVKGFQPDLVVSWFWTAKLPVSLIRDAPLGGIGAHPSLLPRHRGPDPYFAAIDGGDTETGVTIHRLEAEYDTGPILAVAKIRIDPSWTAWQLAKRLDRPSLALLRDVVARLERGERLEEHAQDESVATFAAEPDEDACALRWTWPTARLLRRVRALSPAPGAYTALGPHALTIVRAEGTDRYPRALAPGEATVVEGRAVVRTCDGALALLAGEIDGDWAEMESFATLVAQSREKMIG
jgi:methionyl-tRNA formyltransferase